MTPFNGGLAFLTGSSTSTKSVAIIRPDGTPGGIASQLSTAALTVMNGFVYFFGGGAAAPAPSAATCSAPTAPPPRS